MTESKGHRPPGVGYIRGEQVGSISDSPPTAFVKGDRNIFFLVLFLGVVLHILAWVI